MESLLILEWKREAGPVRRLATHDVDVRSVDFEERDDPGGRELLVGVKLAPPSADTWPADELYEFRRRVREVVAQRFGEQLSFQLTYISAGSGGPFGETTGAPLDPSPGLSPRLTV